MPLEFPAEAPFDFGADFVPTETAIEGTSLAWIESHCADGISLLLPQFRGKPRIEAVVCALVEPVQELDDACWQILVGRSLDSAVGVQLDGIGQIVDLGRIGWTDDQYRRFLRAQVLTLRSSGTWPDMFAILDALGFFIPNVRVDEVTSAQEIAGTNFAWMRIVAYQPVFDGLAHDVYAMLLRAKPAGVRLLFEVNANDEDDTIGTFTLSSSDVTITGDLEEGYGSTVNLAVGGAYAGVFSSSAGA